MDFMRTMEQVVTAEHAYLPPTIEPKLKPAAAARLRATIAEFAQEYWKDLPNPYGRPGRTSRRPRTPPPEAYLKCWALSKPVLAFGEEMRMRATVTTYSSDTGSMEISLGVFGMDPVLGQGFGLITHRADQTR